MKFLFFGDCMFGRDNNSFIENPFVNVEHILKDSSHIFFNLETTISEKPLPIKYKRPKTFNYQSNGIQLKVLRKLAKKKPIFVSIANNHSLDYSVKGFENTKKFLKSNGFLCNAKNKVVNKNIIFINATDHCGCKNEKLWGENIIMIDYKNLEPIYERIINIRKKDKKRIIVFSIHWGSNWIDGEMPDYIKGFGKKLIDSGVNIVFGHSAHHILQTPIEEYKSGLIIYGLGDFINDYSVKQEYKSDHALMCQIVYSKGNLTYELINVRREFTEEGGSIPTIF